MKKFMVSALGLLVLLQGLVFAQSDGQTVIMTEKVSDGVRTLIVATKQGKVIQEETFNFPDTVYVNMPFIASQPLIAEATKSEIVLKIDGKEPFSKNGMVVAMAPDTLGFISVVVYNQSGEATGEIKIPVANAPDTFVTKVSQILQPTTINTERHPSIKGDGSNIIYTIDNDSLPVRAARPGMVAVEVLPNIEPGRHSRILEEGGKFIISDTVEVVRHKL